MCAASLRCVWAEPTTPPPPWKKSSTRSILASTGFAQIACTPPASTSLYVTPSGSLVGRCHSSNTSRCVSMSISPAFKRRFHDLYRSPRNAASREVVLIADMPDLLEGCPHGTTRTPAQSQVVEERLH